MNAHKNSNNRLFFFLVSLLAPIVSCQHIKPPSNEPPQDQAYFGTPTRYVDLSDLTLTTNNHNQLSLQLTDDLPIWTVYKNSNDQSTATAASNAFNFWTGLSLDGLVSARFVEYTTPTTGIVVKRGTVHDLSTDITYEVKPDWLGRDTVTEIQRGDLPPVGEPKLPIWSQLYTIAKNPFGFGKAVLRNVGTRIQSLTTSMESLAKQEATWDVLVVWTQNAECAKSNADIDCTVTATTLANMEADILQWVSETNMVHANSGTGITVNVVHQQRDTSGFRETAPSGDLLCQLTDTCNAQLGYIHDLRNQHNADLVTMIMDTLRLSSDPVCGIAWIGTCCLFNDAYGFSINDVACTNYEYTPAHEFGHNMGCEHDRGTSATQCAAGACNSCNTNFGHRVPNTLRTVMSYDCDRYTSECDGTTTTASCPVVAYFSGDATVNGTSLGGTANNCRGTAIQYKQNIANYR